MGCRGVSLPFSQGTSQRLFQPYLLHHGSQYCPPPHTFSECWGWNSLWKLVGKTLASLFFLSLSLAGSSLLNCFLKSASRGLEREAENMCLMPSRSFCTSLQTWYGPGDQCPADHFPTREGQRAWQDASENILPPAKQMKEVLAVFPPPPNQG